MSDNKNNIELDDVVRLPTKKLGDFISFESPEVNQSFEKFFYRIYTLSVRACILLSFFLYAVLNYLVLPVVSPNEHQLFNLAYYISNLFFIGFYFFTFSPFYFSHPKLSNIINGFGLPTITLLAAFYVPSLSPTLFYITAMTMIAGTLSLGLQSAQSLIFAAYYFLFNAVLVHQSGLPVTDHTFGLFVLFGFILIGMITSYMISLHQANSFILKSNTDNLVTALKHNQDIYRELSTKDGLTQLYNRRFFDETGEIKTHEAKRIKTQLHLIVFDIDFFKAYNDQYGHPAGDKVLISAARILKEVFRRPSDFLFRIGGEEFAIITLGDITKNLSINLATVHENFKTANITHKTSPVADYLTISIGMASLNPTDEVDFSDLYHRADKALYHAIQSGRNQTVIY